MSRVRRGGAYLALALMLLGIGASAASALTSGGCCAMSAEPGSSDREGPCHSVAPTSCCEANLTGQAPSLPGAPVCADAVAPAVLGGTPFSGAFLAPPPPNADRIAFAAIVLRL